MNRQNDLITLNRDDLKEVFVEFSRNKDNMTSNFMSDFKKTIIEHSVKIDNLIEMTKKNTESIDTLKESQNRFDGGKSTLMATIGIVSVIILGLIGVVYGTQTTRIDKIEAVIANIK